MKKYILVQDGCEPVRDLYELLFLYIKQSQRSGINILLAKDPTETRSIIEKNGLPSLAIIDCCPPDCTVPTRFNPNDNGLTTISFLRKKPGTDDSIPIFLTTTRKVADLPHTTIAAIGGVTMIMEKPFTNNELLEAIRIALQITPEVS